MLIQEIQHQLRAMLAPTQVISEKEDMATFTSDWRGIYQGNAAAVVYPRTVHEVSEVIKFCADHNLPIVPQGGNTGLCGGATPDKLQNNIVINLARMKAMSLDLDANTITVEAGCILGDIQRLANDSGRLFPLDLAAKDSCQIGGNLSTNAGGINVLRYGMARDQVLGLEVVLPSGEIWNGLRTLKKDNTGLDLKHLFIGAEGTLGIITAATLKLHPKMNAKVVALAAVASPNATLNLLTTLQKFCADRVTGFEYFSAECLELVLTHSPNSRSPFSEKFEHFVLIEIADVGEIDALLVRVERALEEAMEQSLCHDIVLATNETQSASLWNIREGISEALHHDGKHLKHDIALPISRIHDFMTCTAAKLHKNFLGIRPFIFGHYGDGNLHYNIARPLGASDKYLEENEKAITRLILDSVSEFNGSFSAEHGIGQLKREALKERKSHTELQMMHNIKKLFDPKGIMNPGKIF